MAATKSQGRAFSVFMVGLTLATAGIAYFSSGSGKIAFIAGLAVFVASLAMLLKAKPEEGKVAAGPQPAVLKLAGLAVVVVGWLTVLVGLHLTANVAGRMTTTIIGLAVSLIGVLFVLPAAANKNAIWKM
jgi:hypothetical protein